VSAPAGYEFIPWDTGLRCLACGAVIDGTAHWREFPKWHDANCHGTRNVTLAPLDSKDPKNVGSKPETDPN